LVDQDDSIYLQRFSWGTLTEIYILGPIFIEGFAINMLTQITFTISVQQPIGHLLVSAGYLDKLCLSRNLIFSTSVE